MTEAEPSLLPTWIEVCYPADRGAIGLRGNLAPLDWEHTTLPTRTIGDHHLFCVPMREGELLELAVQEMIVVGVHTSADRLNLLGPVPDPTYGGGGPDPPRRDRRRARARELHLPHHERSLVHRHPRQLHGRPVRLLRGWKRPDVYGKVACLSSSFWWSDRWAVRMALRWGGVIREGNASVTDLGAENEAAPALVCA